MIASVSSDQLSSKLPKRHFELLEAVEFGHHVSEVVDPPCTAHSLSGSAVQPSVSEGSGTAQTTRSLVSPRDTASSRHTRRVPHSDFCERRGSRQLVLSAAQHNVATDSTDKGQAVTRARARRAPAAETLGNTRRLVRTLCGHVLNLCVENWKNIQTTERYSAVKRKEILPHTAAGMSPEDRAQWPSLSGRLCPQLLEDSASVRS